METKTRTEPVGLRERKKQRTRGTIVDAAVHLFVEQGYAETTIVDIAAAAEVAPSTFFNHFASKLDLVFGLLDAIIASAERRILQRELDESATDAILSWVLEDLAAVERPYTTAMRYGPQIIESDIELQSAERLRVARLEDIFAEAYARDLGESPHGVPARVMATIALRGMSEVWESWYALHVADAEFDIGESVVLKAEYLRPALAAGLAAITSLPPTPESG
jgi:AcrR family transcriptional regulator